MKKIVIILNDGYDDAISITAIGSRGAVTRKEKLMTNKTKKPARYVNIEDREELVDAIIALHSSCKVKHKNGCLAPDCKSCLDRTFEHYRHLLPTATDVVKVTKCKNCTWHDSDSDCTNPKCTKSYYGCKTDDDFYCGYAEEKEKDFFLVCDSIIDC